MTTAGEVGRGYSHQHFLTIRVGGEHFDLYLIARAPQLFEGQPYSFLYAKGLYVHLSQCLPPYEGLGIGG